MGEKIRVPFNMAKTAKSLGAEYDPITGFYEMPDTAKDNDKEKLITSFIKEINKIPESKNSMNDSQYSNSLIRNIEKMPTIESDKKIITITPVVLKKHDWSDILNNIKDWNTIKFLSYLKEYGLPENKKQRINMLKWLNTKVKGQYTLAYPALAEYSPEFNKTYGWEIVNDITRIAKITGANFEFATYNAQQTGIIDEEEEALLRFVFPIAISSGIDTREQIHIPEVNETEMAR